MKKLLIGVFILLLLLAGADYFVKQNGKEQVLKKDEQLVNSESQAEVVNGGVEYGLKIGDKAPDFTLETLTGETISLHELTGKRVILNFWATWCPPCREEMPEMEKVYKKFKNNDVEIVAVNSTVGKETKEKAGEFANKLGLTFKIPLDIKGEVIKQYQIYGLPTSFFIDADGVIRSIYYGPMNLEYMSKELEKMS